MFQDQQLAHNLRLTTTRDFRVNIKKVTELMNRNNVSFIQIFNISLYKSFSFSLTTHFLVT